MIGYTENATVERETARMTFGATAILISHDVDSDHDNLVTNFKLWKRMQEEHESQLFQQP